MKTLQYALAHLEFRDRLSLSLILIFGSSLAFLDLAGIALVGLTVTVASGNTSALTGISANLSLFVGQLGIQNSYALIAVIAVIFFSLKTAISLLVTSRTSKYLANLEARKGTALFRTILNGNYDQIAPWSENQVVYGVTSSTGSAFNKIFTATFSLVTEFTLLVTIAIYLATVHFGAFLSLFMFFALLSVALYLSVVRLNGKLSSAAMRSGVKSGDLVYEAIANFRQIYTAGQGADFVARFSTLRHASASATARMGVMNLVSRYITEISLMLGLGALLIQRSLPNAEAISASVISIFVVGALRIIASLIPLQGHLSTIKQVDAESEMAINLAESCANNLQISRDKEEQANLQVDLEGPEINVRNMGYRYVGASSDALSEVSLDIPFGEFLAVVGKSGAGKSTFADVLMGLREPSYGEVLVGKIKPKGLVSLHPGIIAYVPQATRLISGTVVENITLNLSGHFDSERLENAIQVANLTETIDSLPSKRETHLGPQARSLSGGQIQRIGLARAIYLNPKILILDEATSSLDDETEAHISESLAELRGRISLVVIAHRVTTLEGADRVANFEGGRLEVFSSMGEMSAALKRRSMTIEEVLGEI